MTQNVLHRTFRYLEKTGLRSFLVSSVFLFAFLCTATLATSQVINPELRVLVREDNRAVHIYHTALPAIGHGFNIYRKRVTEEDFQKINIDPIRGVTSGNELRAYLGTLYDDIEQNTRQNTANGTFTKLRSDIRTANLLSFVYPKVAEALGRVYVDPSAPVGEPVTYKVEFVDALDNPNGVLVEETFILLPQKPAAPIHLRAQNLDNRVMLHWQYPLIKEGVDDKVIHFLVYRIDPATNEHEQVNEKVILKNEAIFEYAYSFEIPNNGQTEQFYVRAVDISGQQSNASEILRFEASDIEPPHPVLEIQARKLSNRRIEVQWTPSEAEDIRGYNLYRSTSLNDKASYVRLNNSILSQLETTFNDTLSSEIINNVYYYRVTALDDQGNESPFSVATLALVEDDAPPASPENLTVQFTEDNKVQLSWDYPIPPDDFKTFVVLRYHDHPGSPPLPSRVNIEDLVDASLVDEGIAGLGFNEGNTYKYEVFSIDYTGNASLPITAVIDIPDNTAPDSPSGVHALLEDASRITIFWNPSASDDVMSYIIYRRQQGSSELQAYLVPNTQRRYQDMSVQPGISYEYWLTAADYAGNESLPSEKREILMRDFTPPRYVRNVQAISNNNQVFLHWEPVPSDDLAGYQIYRSNSISGEFSPLADRLITGTQWTDDAATENSWYKVFAIDSSGNKSTPSDPIQAMPLKTENK